MPRVLLFVVLLGVLIYLAIRLLRRPGGASGGRTKRRPVAPDDDPTFLRGLDDQLWQERHGQGGQRDGTDDGTTPGAA